MRDLRFYFYRLLTRQIRESNHFVRIMLNLKNYNDWAHAPLPFPLRILPWLPPATSWADNPKFAFHGRHLNYLPGQCPPPPSLALSLYFSLALSLPTFCTWLASIMRFANGKLRSGGGADSSKAGLGQKVALKDILLDVSVSSDFQGFLPVLPIYQIPVSLPFIYAFNL